MIRFFLIGWGQLIKSDIEGERYYIRLHSQEFLRNVAPWLTRYETYRAYEPPAEAKRFGAVSAYLTEQWWRSVEDYQEARGGGPLTPYKDGLNVMAGATMTVTTARPTEDLLGKKLPAPEEMPILRWLRAFKYPDGVSLEEGDKWYLQTYSQQAKEQEGLLRYVSYRCIKPSPSTGDNMVRVEELWYRDFDAWRKAVIESPPRYTPPPWGRKEEPFVDMVSTFVRLKPTWDWFRGGPYATP